MLLIDGLLGDAAHCFKFEHVIDEVGSLLHHEGRAWHWLATLHGGLRLVGSFEVHVGVIVSGGSHHHVSGLLLVVLLLRWGVNRRRGTDALSAVSIAIICTIFLYRMDVHTGLEVELPRELIRQSSITAVDVRIMTHGGLCPSASETLRAWIECHKVLPEHRPA